MLGVNAMNFLGIWLVIARQEPLKAIPVSVEGGRIGDAVR